MSNVKVVQADCKEREQRAMAKIQAVLAEERCVLTPIMVLMHGRVEARLEINAVERVG